MRDWITFFMLYAFCASEAQLDIAGKLSGGEGYEYEKKETKVTVDISTNCDSCKVNGHKEALFDGKLSTKFIVEATSTVDIDSSTIVINVDVRYNTRKTHLNHFSITSSDNINL